MLNFHEYEELAYRTDGTKDLDLDTQTVYCGLAIAGEAGELADYIKKVYFQGKPLEKTKLLLEMGDILWGLSKLARVLDTSLATIAHMNIQKLKERYPEGFSVDAANNRPNDPED